MALVPLTLASWHGCHCRKEHDRQEPGDQSDLIRAHGDRRPGRVTQTVIPVSVQFRLTRAALAVVWWAGRLHAALARHPARPNEVVAPLGAGGMGEVFRARDPRLKRDVALKILPSAFVSEPDRLARFEREAQVLASLNHPNIAQIYSLWMEAHTA